MSNNATYLITGATSGIGEAVAQRLAATGSRVLLGARNPTSGRQAVERIRARTADARLHVVSGDLSEMRQVRRLAEQVHDASSRLDGVILNAAEVRTTRQLTSEGFETNFATNYLAGFLLTALLLPLLKTSQPARIVTVSSSNHTHVKRIDIHELAAGENFRHTNSYSTTKLLNVLHATAMAPLLHGSGVSINVADPGFVRTNLGRHATGGFAVFLKLASIFQDTPVKAADTPVYLLTTPDVEGVNGKYFTRSRPGKPSALSQDPAVATKVRELSIDLLTSRQLATRPELTP